MSQSAPAQKTRRDVVRIDVHVQLDEDLAEWARHHRARTRETVSGLVNRLLRTYSQHGGQPDTAA